LQRQTLVQNEAVASLAATQASAAGEALVAKQALMMSEELAMQLRAANTRLQEEAVIAYRQAESATEQRLRSEFQRALANTRAGEQKAADQAERAVQQASLSVAQQAMANEQLVQSRLAEVLRKTEAEVALARAQADEEVRRQRDASTAAALEAQRTLQATWQEMQNTHQRAKTNGLGARGAQGESGKGNRRQACSRTGSICLLRGWCRLYGRAPSHS
jgi:hypothetical protein